MQKKLNTEGYLRLKGFLKGEIFDFLLANNLS